MSNLINVRTMLERAYIGMVEDALKKGGKRTDNVLRCCKCGRCDVTLKKLHKDVYACTDCINKRAINEAQKEMEKQGAEYGYVR